ncbi:trypsin-like serine protease [Lysinibacter sp. HNR]|uniref:trypsin-like serine peptidase n=1 Tax=Lysinibacter sp. HNR TaxID=3031408 RepID=UPI002435FB6D|nr:trypsin-like serine protease [Lysinibacter sp. HNR]WGD37886.1 trypsin-like serine protease [Lysinibacter sp. HNR]
MTILRRAAPRPSHYAHHTRAWRHGGAATLTLLTLTLTTALGPTASATSPDSPTTTNTRASNDATAAASTEKLPVGNSTPSSRGSGNPNDVRGEFIKTDGRISPATSYAGGGIIGEDKRKLVTTFDEPYDKIVLIQREKASGTTHCTGALVDVAVILTAAHCLQTKADGAAALNDITLTLRSDPQKFTLPKCGISDYRVAPGWSEGESTSRDWALIKSQCSFGQFVGFFGTHDRPDEDFPTNHTLTGFPGDKKPNYYTFPLYEDSGLVHSVPNDDSLWYDKIDATNGQSGSPIWYYNNNEELACTYCIVGVHSSGVDGGIDQFRRNFGTRVTTVAQEFMDDLAGISPQ